MLDVALPYQMYPDCNIVTKFNIDVDNDFFLINDMQIYFPNFSLNQASVLHKQFRSTNSLPIVSKTYPKLVRYDFYKDYILINGMYNMYNTNLSSYNKFKSQLTINNERTIQIYDTRIEVCTIDGNIIPFKGYDTTKSIRNAIIDTDGEYIYVLTFTSDYRCNYYVFSDYKDLRNSLIYSANLGEAAYIIDYNEQDNIIILYDQYDLDKFSKYKLNFNSHQLIYSYLLPLGVSINYVPTNIIVPKTMYNYGFYSYQHRSRELKFFNLDEYNNQVNEYSVELTYNGYKEIPSDVDANNTFCSKIVNNQFDMILCYDNYTLCYRVKIDDTDDLKCEIIGFTQLENTFSYFTRISQTRTDLTAGVRESDFTYYIIKYLPDLKIYDYVEIFNTTSLAFFTLSDNMTYYITHDEYDSSNTNYTEIKKRQIKPTYKIYVDLPDSVNINDISQFKVAVYELISESFVKDIPVQFHIKRNGHFVNGENTIWFYSQDSITTVTFYAESNIESIEIEYSFKGSQQ